MLKRPAALAYAALGAACLAAIAFNLFLTLDFCPVPGRLLSLNSGCVRFAWWDPRYLRIGYDRFEMDRADGHLRWLPFHDGQPLVQWIGLPLWIPAAASIALFLRARRRALGPGFCPACNYDRRATPGGSPCPECGAPQRTSAAGPSPSA
jgi:hypothetical protein